MNIKVYTNDRDLLRAMTDQLISLINKKDAPVFNLALSGGLTAQKMFDVWVNEYRSLMPWDKLRFFWVDEQCVPASDPGSYYGNAYRLLFEPLQIPAGHIHQIRGEEDPGVEAVRYSWEVKEFLSRYDQLPIFDCIILGVAPDAHIASIFPDTPKLLYDSRIYTVSQHPTSGQYRITMTGPLILNNAPLLVPILGAGKQEVKKKLKQDYKEGDEAPASYILNKAKDVAVFMIEED